VVLNEGVSVSCGKKGAKRAVLDKKINGLSDFSHFLAKFLPRREQATKRSIQEWRRELFDMAPRKQFESLFPEVAIGRHHAHG
jgi:hypothetical protein